MLEKLSCHSNKTTCTTAIKHTIYVEDNIINIYAKTKLYPPLMASEKKIFGKKKKKKKKKKMKKIENLAFQLQWQPIKIRSLGKIHMAGWGLL